MMKKQLSSLLAILLLSFACTEEEDNPGTNPIVKPQITIVNPSDTVALSDSIPVNIIYTDDKELSFTEISLGTETGGNMVYHFSQRGLSGTTDELNFKVYVPPVINSRGVNYILVKCRDSDGNESILDQNFFVKDPDDIAPFIGNVFHNGFLSSSGGVVFEVEYEVQDDKALDRVVVRLLEWDGQNVGNEMERDINNLNGQTRYFGVSSFSGSNYAAGLQYRVEIRVFDEAGNLTTQLLPQVFSVQ